MTLKLARVYELTLEFDNLDYNTRGYDIHLNIESIKNEPRRPKITTKLANAFDYQNGKHVKRTTQNHQKGRAHITLPHNLNERSKLQSCQSNTRKC